MKPLKPDKKRIDQYVKYSGIAIQMFVIIFGGTWLGMKFDKWLDLSFPVFTVVISLFSVFAAIYLAIKDFIRK